MRHEVYAEDPLGALVRGPGKKALLRNRDFEIRDGMEIVVFKDIHPGDNGLAEATCFDGLMGYISERNKALLNGDYQAKNGAFVNAFLNAGYVVMANDYSISTQMGYDIDHENVQNSLAPNTDRASGGSSSGAGALAASGLILVTRDKRRVRATVIATCGDYAGSTRYPAAVNGTFGVVPSTGLILSSADAYDLLGMSVDAVMTGNPRRDARCLDVMPKTQRAVEAGHFFNRPNLGVFGRIAVSPSLDSRVTSMDKLSEEAVNNAIRRLERAGITVKEAKPRDLPLTGKELELKEAYADIATHAAKLSWDKMVEAVGEEALRDIPSHFRMFAEIGRHIEDEASDAVETASRIRTDCLQRQQRLRENNEAYDAWLWPTMRNRSLARRKDLKLVTPLQKGVLRVSARAPKFVLDRVTPLFIDGAVDAIVYANAIGNGSVTCNTHEEGVGTQMTPTLWGDDARAINTAEIVHEDARVMRLQA
ncbi:MAG: amidase family protein [Patescibacteria group bacterium]